MNAVACPDDLLLAARAGALSNVQRRTLHDHMVGCELCRLSLRAARALGPLPPIDADDEALAARLVARATAPQLPQLSLISAFAPAQAHARRHGRAPAARFAIRRWAAAALIVLAAGTASAGIWRAWPQIARRLGTADATTSAAEARAVAARGARRRSAAPPPEVDPPAVAAPDDSPPDPPVAAAPVASPRAPVPRPAITAAAATAARLTPSELFRDANEARHARQVDDAARRYRQLQREFPDSPEAKLSFLSLGDLYLARGEATRALAAFDAYLATAAPELRDEATVGKAKALARLGRSYEERALWRALLARDPGSEYRWRAHQRLHDLEKGAL